MRRPNRPGGSRRERPGRGFGALVAAGGVGLPVVAVVALALLLLPVPAWLVDALITASLGAALWLLALALGTPSRRGLGFLPNYLLLTTLFRLALNLATTRLILTQGYAGAVIDSFGRFVVGGSYVVGGVVFAIITIVQFVVVARGTSRVAEVTARFSLDGLPGRQRGIDAELAARAIDATEARRRRAQLERESLLHGGLDGAMRFVRGDALAGLLITLVNLLGGVLLGVLRWEMGLGQALAHFALLTIGDGLAAQIPSLLTAIAAGLVVTRVAGADPDARPGAELARQVLARPDLIALVAGVLGLLALLPGLPAWPFLGVALGLGLLAGAAWRWRPERAPELLEPALRPRLVLQLTDAAWDALPERELARELRLALGELGDRLGVPVPLPTLERWGGAPLGSDDSELDADPRMLRLLLDGSPVLRTRVASEDVADPAAAAARVAQALHPHAGELLGVAETRALLDRLALSGPALVRAVVPERVDVPTLAAVLRGLLRGGVPVADLRGVLEALAAAPRTEATASSLLERVRCARPRVFSQHLARPDRRIGVFVVDPLVEEAVRDAGRAFSQEGTVRLDRSLLSDLRHALRRCTPDSAWLDPRDPRPLLLTSPEVRAPLEAALAGRARVITGRELDPEFPLEPLGTFGPGG